MIYKNPLKRLINASKYSLQGLYYALKNEQAFRYEFIVLILLGIALFFTPEKYTHKIFLILSWLIVMALELVNSSVEKAFDLIDSNFRPQIKAGKDMLSASVFIMVCFNITLWILSLINIFLNR